MKKYLKIGKLKNTDIRYRPRSKGSNKSNERETPAWLETEGGRGGQ